jgi:hypothetical protein
MPTARAASITEAQPPDELKSVRLHITPLKPELLKVYLAPSVLPLATNISYHTVETFPERGFGYVELPEADALKLKKKLHGTTLRGSKVRIEMAKPEKRKVRDEADAAKEKEEAERPPKRVKKEKRKKEDGVLEGVELPDERKVKRGWTDPAVKSKDRKEKKEKKEREKDGKHEQKKSKYTREAEVLFKAKLTPVAATEVARKEKKKEKKEKKSKSREVVVHEFATNTKTPSFIKEPKVNTEKKPPVEYINGQGWVDEDGNLVEAETGKARNRRLLELVDKPAEVEKPAEAKASPRSSPASKTNKKRGKHAPPPATEDSDDDDSSVVSSSSEDLSASDDDSDAESVTSVTSPTPNDATTPKVPQATGAAEKEVHPLEALFKRAKPTPGPIDLTPAKKLTPITTSFSFFENGDDMDVGNAGEAVDNAPSTPYTQRDLEWRGLRSAAPTPDTAAIGRRFSFDWRKGSQEVHDAEDDDEEMGDADAQAEQQLSLNTKANASHARLPDVAEEGEEAVAAAEGEEEKPESEFRKWFWENRGDLNRAWKKRRRDALKAKRHTENRKMTPHRRVN